MIKYLKNWLGGSKDSTEQVIAPQSLGKHSDTSQCSNTWNSIESMFIQSKTLNQDQEVHLQLTNLRQNAFADSKEEQQYNDEDLKTLGFLYLYNNALTPNERDSIYLILRSRANYISLTSYDIRARHARQWRQRQDANGST